MSTLEIPMGEYGEHTLSFGVTNDPADDSAILILHADTERYMLSERDWTRPRPARPARHHNRIPRLHRQSGAGRGRGLPPAPRPVHVGDGAPRRHGRGTPGRGADPRGGGIVPRPRRPARRPCARPPPPREGRQIVNPRVRGLLKTLADVAILLPVWSRFMRFLEREYDMFHSPAITYDEAV